MLARSSKYAAYSIRAYIAPLTRRQHVGLASRYSKFSSVANSDGSHDRPDKGNKVPSASDYEDEDPHLKNSLRTKARTEKLDVDSLGKPGQIVVVPLRKRRRPRIKNDDDSESIPSFSKAASSVSAKFFVSDRSNENEHEDYVAYLEELRAPYSSGATISREEYIELQEKIETGFTSNQLSSYYSSFSQRTIPALPEENIEARQNGNDVDDDEKWQPIQSREELADNKPLSEDLSRSQKSKKAYKRKDALAQQIIRDCWQLGLHDEMGSLKIKVPSQIISFILSSDQYSLEELAHTHNTKIEPFGSLDFIQVWGNRSACESVRDIVKSYSTEIHTESFEQPLLNDKSWILDGKEAKSRFLESIAQTLGIHISDPGRSSVASAAFTANDEEFARVKRDLEFANSTVSANEKISFCVDVPSSASGFMQRISTKRRQNMSLLEREKPWARWRIPASLQDYSEDSLPPLFSQQKPTLSSEMLQVLRENSTKTRQHGLEEKLSATIGQCLFHTPDSLDSLARINATQLGERSLPRYFHGWLHPKGTTFVGTRRIFPGDRTQIRLHRFKMTPCYPNDSKLPILEVEISVPWTQDPEAKFPFAGPELLSVKAVVEETSIDYLLPEVNHDIRFTRTLTREIFGVNQTEQPGELRNAIMSSLTQVLNDPTQPFPPSCQVPLPWRLLDGILPSQKSPADSEFMEGKYWFPGVEHALGTMVRTYEYSGERLCFSPNAKGSLDSKSDQLYLEMFVNSMPSYYTRMQHRNNVDETLDPANDTLDLEFRAFYMTACQLAIELTQHSPRKSRAAMERSQ